MRQGSDDDHNRLQTRGSIAQRAEAEGLTVPAYVERLVEADQSAEDELESLALEGMSSGDPIAAGPATGKKSTAVSMIAWKKTARGEREPLCSQTQSRPGS